MNLKECKEEYVGEINGGKEWRKWCNGRISKTKRNSV